MYYELGDAERTLRRQATEIAERVLAPKAGHIDATGEFPEEGLQALGEAGFLGITAGDACDGKHHPALALAIVMEELAKACASTALLAAQQNASICHPLNCYGTPEQKERLLKSLATGKRYGAAALMEPGAGHDGLNQITSAVPDGDAYVLNGHKNFVMGGDRADLFLIFARSNMQLGNRGFSAFLVKRGTPGLEVCSQGNSLGHRGAKACEVMLKDVRMPTDNRLGEEGQGFRVALDVMDFNRVAMAALAIGIGETLLQTATEYAIRTFSFGKPLADSQAVQWMLADSVTELEAARLLTRRAAKRLDKSVRASSEASMAKIAAARAASAVADRAMQIHGPEGYLEGTVVERGYRDAKLGELYEGNNYLQHLVIVRHMIPTKHADRPDLMAFTLNDEQKMLRDMMREFAESEVAPLVEQSEREGRFPRELVMRMWEELGLGGMLASEQYGGQALSPISYNLVIEELAAVWPSLAIIVAVHNSVSVQLIDLHGSEQQKATYIPKLTSEWVGAFSLSEPGAGSDVGALRATAVREGDYYVLNGEKNWVTNGGNANLYVVFAKTDPQAGNRGISAFLVERETPGLSVSKPERKMGIKSSEAVSLLLEDCRVPVENRLGKEGDGFLIAMKELDGGRIGVGSQALGISKGALDRALRYSRERTAFGRPIGQFQAIQWMLADMIIRLDAARLLVYNAAWLQEHGKPHSRQASMAKLYASETATFITHKAIQVHGGYGYTEDYQVERFYRDARVTEIYEGTSEIQRLVISRNWFKEHGHKTRM